MLHTLTCEMGTAVKESAKTTIMEVVAIWRKTSISLKLEQSIIRYVKEIYAE